MIPTLRDEIQQARPFTTAAEEALVNLVRTSRIVGDAGELLLREYGLSQAQYNVLRILRGSAPAGLGRNEIRDRLIARMPDVTRLLDRMEEAGLVRRERDTDDRRCVPTYITPKGQELVDELDGPVRAHAERSFGHLSASQLEMLNALLVLVRNPPVAD
ncbi:MAG: MarR family winged helix-turn-helix transcriptional regulator [Gemmatimonadaceae bacterium]